MVAQIDASLNGSLLGDGLSKETTLAEELAERQKIFSHFPNIAYNVIGIAASAGGVRAIRTVLSALPSNFPAAIVVVLHLNPNYPSHLPYILDYYTSLQADEAKGGELLRPGNVYTAAPGKHLLVKPDGTLALSEAPKANFSRPSADKLFRSLAASYQKRAIAVVLTGGNGDGALGAVAIKKHGGIVIAQDQATSEHFEMPKAAIETGKVDLVLPLEAIAPTLIELVMTEKAA